MWIKPLFLTLFLVIITAMLIAPDFSWAATKVFEFDNPIKAKSFEELVSRLADALLRVVLPLAAAAIIFAGFKLIISASSGDSGGVTKAKQMLGWVILGTAIVVGASVLTKIVINIVETL